jgi:transposase
MSADSATSKSTDNRDVPASVVELPVSELDGLISRVEQAKKAQLTLSAEDCDLLLNAVLTLASMQERLSHNDLTIAKLKKLLGIVRSSEKTRDLFPDAQQGKDTDGQADEPASADAGKADSTDDKGTDAKDKKDKRDRRSGQKDPGKSRKPPRPKPPTTHKHALDGLSKGDPCPECPDGKLYKYTPAVLIRIVGNEPLSCERHLSEQLRCGNCGEIFTASLPAHVKADGRPGQKYGYSARALLALFRFFAGLPYHRQQTVHNLMGGHIAASTVFDQCEFVANALHPVFKAIMAMAANGTIFHIDDTSNRILQQEPVIKTRSGKQRLRTGVYSSVCVAMLACGRRLTLFQTNVGHAGEWMEEILQRRDPQLDTPVVMSDALSANRVIAPATHVAFCNSHGRRNFAELSEQHPRQVLKILQLYKQVWINDDHCGKHPLSDIERRDYHQQNSLPVMQQIRTFCEQHLASEADEQPIVEPNSNLGKAMRYFIKHFTGLSAFCQIPGAPIDNNGSERALKILIRGRKNSLFHQTAAGANIADVICSVLAICHEHEIDALAYLIAIQANQLQVKAAPEKWMPWNYPASTSKTELEIVTTDSAAAA